VAEAEGKDMRVFWEQKLGGWLGFLLILFVIYFIASVIGLIPEQFAYLPTAVPFP